MPQIYIHLYHAQAFEALGIRREALEALNSALGIALPDGALLPFAENYAGIKGLLPDADCDDKTLQSIMALAETIERGVAAIQGRTPLSPRENEVLLLLQEGLSNPEIAERLHVSLSTAKVIVSNVLSKKGVSSRELLKNKK